MPVKTGIYSIGFNTSPLWVGFKIISTAPAPCRSGRTSASVTGRSAPLPAAKSRIPRVLCTGAVDYSFLFTISGCRTVAGYPAEWYIFV